MKAAGPHSRLPQNASTVRNWSRSTRISMAPVVESERQTATKHGDHHQPWATNHEHRPNGSIPNGYNHAISPPQANGPPYHAQPPPPGQQYAPPVTPYTQTPYMNDFGTAQQIRRKPVRATQACNHCRSRKQKCDEARPCQFCRGNNFDCQYNDVPPPKCVAFSLPFVHR
jgi:hypothetical protein